MARSSKMFEVGDRVVHPTRGAGTVVGIERKGIRDKICLYYIIDLIAQEGKLLVPIANAEKIGLRQVVGKDAIKQVFRVLAASPNPLPNGRKERQVYIIKKLETGDIRKVTEVIRNLAWLEKSSKLTVTDAKLLERAKGFLAGELALAEGIEFEEALAQVNEFLEGEKA